MPLLGAFGVLARKQGGWAYRCQYVAGFQPADRRNRLSHQSQHRQRAVLRMANLQFLGQGKSNTGKNDCATGVIRCSFTSRLETPNSDRSWQHA
jgi:hypothetical protein